MLRTRSGYCGGTTKAPTYMEIGDHTEAVSIDFDPTVVRYEDLLAEFWEAHRCGAGGTMRQYRIAVFYHNDAQRRVAEKSLARAAAKQGVSMEDVQTVVVPVGVFTYAETYHQNHYLTRHPDVRSFLESTYPSGKEFADSTVATRLNAFLGWGFDRDVVLLEREIDGYGLPEALRKEILARVRQR